MMATSLVSWQNAPSIHQAPLLETLALRPDVHVTLVVESDLSQVRRKRSGWNLPEYRNIHYHVSPSDGERRRLEKLHGGADLHIFSGLGAYPQTYGSFKRLVATKARTAVVLEQWDPTGWRAAGRSAKYRALARRWRRHLDAVLVIGELGLQQYRLAGFPPEKLFPFGYFVHSPGSSRNSVRQSSDGKVDLLYVGSLTRQKNVVSIVNALPDLDDSVRLTVVGDGPLRELLKARATELNVACRVTWVGTVPNREVGEYLATSDLLILPSYYDGWGAVINESLLVGTPVVVSRAAGSAQLIVNDRLGVVVDPGARLSALLQTVVQRIQIGEYDRGYVLDWANRHVSAEAGANYLEAIVKSLRQGAARPSAPWEVRSN